MLKSFKTIFGGDALGTAIGRKKTDELDKGNISQFNLELLKDDLHLSFESRGEIEAKDKRDLVMYFVSKVKSKTLIGLLRDLFNVELFFFVPYPCLSEVGKALFKLII